MDGSSEEFSVAEDIGSSVLPIVTWKDFDDACDWPVTISQDFIFDEDDVVFLHILIFVGPFGSMVK